MARGNCIIVSAFPQGKFFGGYIAAGETPKPGTILQVDPTVALKSGRHTYKLYNRDADGDRPAGPFFVLCEDSLQGRDMETAYVAGEFAPRIYCPEPGDELNLLFMNVTGTADDIVAGDIAIVDDGTGKVTKTTGAVETEVAIFLEAYTDPTADRLLWCQWSGQ